MNTQLIMQTPQYNPNYYNDFQTIKIENLETEIQKINKKYQKKL